MDLLQTPGRFSFGILPTHQSTPQPPMLRSRRPKSASKSIGDSNFSFGTTPLLNPIKSIFASSQLFSKANHAIFVLESLEQMWRDELACDFVIKVGEELFTVHKALLVATSDYFRAMIASKMKEGKEGFVDMKGVEASAIKCCLEYLYTGKTTLTSDNIFEVLQATSILQLGELEKVCYEFLKKNLSSESCVLTLQTSQLYDQEELEKLSQEFFTSQFLKVTNSADFFNLTKDDALRYILEFSANDDMSWKASKNWIEYEMEVRDEEVNEFFNMLDLTQFPSEFLLKDTWETEYFHSCDICVSRMYQRIFSNVLELSENVNIHNCFILNEMAQSYDHTVQEIHSIIFGFMLKKFARVTSMEEFVELPEKDVKSLFQSPHAVYFSSERIKWNAALKWIKAKPKERTKVFKVLMKSIAFEKLPQDFVQESVRKESLIQKFPDFQKVLLDAAFSKPPQDLSENFVAILDSTNGLNVLGTIEKKWHPLHFSTTSKNAKITSLNGHLCILDGKDLHIAKSGKWWQMASLTKEVSASAQMITCKDYIYVFAKDAYHRYDSLTDSWQEGIPFFFPGDMKFIAFSTNDALFMLCSGSLPVLNSDDISKIAIPSDVGFKLDEHSSAACCQGNLFVCGSQPGNRSVAKYDLKAKQWKKITSPQQMLNGRSVKLAVVDQKVVSYLVESTTELLFEFYDDKLENWVAFRNAPPFRSRGVTKSITSICSFQDAKLP